MRIGLLVIAVLGLSTAPAAAQTPQPLHGPSGTSDSKVLVIGTDGTRVDSVDALAAAGRAPVLRQLGADGFAVPSLLDYGPPQAATLSEVGWSTIATGVWPEKHGVNGIFLNNDPRQATKNGFPDFLTRLEQVRPQLSTFLASDWPNIGRHENGGPIFGDKIDARHAIAAAGTIEGYDDGDEEVTDVSARYLREGDPDAGFVYLGVVDEVAHLAGSRTDRYRQAIQDTDRRIGRLLAAIRARPTYLQERWTVVVTTDHGQQDLAYPSQVSHGFGSDLERTSFVTAAGFGLTPPPPFADIRVVDIAPTVLARLGVPIDPSWRLDGTPFATEAIAPPPRVTAGRRGRMLRVDVSAPPGSPGLRTISLTLPVRQAVRSVRATPRARVVRIRGGREVRVTLAGPGTRAAQIRLHTPRPPRSGSLRVVVTDTSGHRTTRTVRAR